MIILNIPLLSSYFYIKLPTNFKNILNVNQDYVAKKAIQAAEYIKKALALQQVEGVNFAEQEQSVEDKQNIPKDEDKPEEQQDVEEEEEKQEKQGEKQEEEGKQEKQEEKQEEEEETSSLVNKEYLLHLKHNNTTHIKLSPCDSKGKLIDMICGTKDLNLKVKLYNANTSDHHILIANFSI